MLRRAVFLDRDGVLNRTTIGSDGHQHPPTSLAELQLLPRVGAACSKLRRLGYLLIVVTNQPDVARGTQTRDAVAAINASLTRRLCLDDVRTCYHDDSDECQCRKPAAGLILEGARQHGVDIPRSYVVGDRRRDVEAGINAGCIPILVGGHAQIEDLPGVERRASLWAAACWIEAQHTPVGGSDPRQTPQRLSSRPPL